MATTPPGWYDDGRGALRWWDGTQWTEHVAAPDPETGDTATAPTEAEIVAASERADAAEPVAAEPVAAEVDAATALGIGVPPAAGAPGSPGYPGYDPAAGHPQGAYPGGYPGADAPGGAFTAATEPRKSKLWILWVVLGVVMLGIVIAAAVVIPILFLNLAAGGPGSSSGVEASGADQEAAVAAVQLYDAAWQDVDCDAYVDSTTQEFRDNSNLADCESFTAAASEFAVGVEDYVVTVTEIEAEGDSIVVSTTESYNALLDEAGEPHDEPVAEEVDYEYTVVSVDGDWVIDFLEN